jgi:tetratricopeptide (TPR) repeat protein
MNYTIPPATIEGIKSTIDHPQSCQRPKLTRNLVFLMASLLVPIAAASAPADDFKDAQGRFLTGLIFTEQKKIPDAIDTFTGFTEDNPELPGAYNNLAMSYSGHGNYDKAKGALKLAIHIRPAYATAHENLKDIVERLARRAYDKALQLDKSNITAQSKLAMVKEMFTVPTPAVATATKIEPARLLQQRHQQNEKTSILAT